jgi:hypothetical protein
MLLCTTTAFHFRLVTHLLQFQLHVPHLIEALDPLPITTKSILESTMQNVSFHDAFYKQQQNLF